MGEDVIEFAIGRPEVAQIGDAQIEIAEPQRGSGLTRFGDRLRGQVDAHETALGQVVRKWDHIAARAAANLEHAATRHGRGIHAEECGNRRESVGMSLAPRERTVGDFIVGIVRHGRTIIPRVGLKTALPRVEFC